ncbi:CYTH domain-containing protein [Paenibacillus sp. CGMCC 1.16610]|uniref:CYTH domain-containing protein n=1 Tax=Paenibacillus anseongense TaxID=2682845 RepID=A0ABW9UKR2_9BACL|nr:MULTISPECIES: CYTH domain-containing protein [Paenibacillus]MBA2943464.1 CYTH domain-containing protein [Paenibacillus sp. CGMCC 1.16610]MVQ40443.1 CYTH domain-containing protein [Paenibacillus anseongense]
MSAEIEKKYLLPAFPASELENQDIKLVSKQYIYQTYLAFSEDQEIRVRKLVDSSGESHFTHTFKSGHGMVREEIEYNISETVYKQLLDHTGLIPLEKIRTTVEHAGLYYEIDEYKQVDLAVVEVEFPSIEAAEQFEAPAWFGRELGSEDEFRNKSMWVALQKKSAMGD